MNACPSDSVLLQFLDGELNAEADARVLALSRTASVCQELLERLTDRPPRRWRGIRRSRRCLPAPRQTSRSATERPRVAAGDVGQLRASGGDGPPARPGRHMGEELGRRMLVCRPRRSHGRSSATLRCPSRSLGGSTAGSRRRRGRPGGRRRPDGTAVRTAALRTVTSGRAEAGSRRHWPTIPGYDILQRCLGEGGMGVVFRAEHRGC